VCNGELESEYSNENFDQLMKTVRCGLFLILDTVDRNDACFGMRKDMEGGVISNVTSYFHETVTAQQKNKRAQGMYLRVIKKHFCNSVNKCSYKWHI
jgi:hypothetical protein